MAGTGPIERTYDRTAGWYDLVGWLWLVLLARTATQAFRSAVATATPTGARVLDLGIGTGLGLEQVLRVSRPGVVIGVDRSSGMLCRARRRWRAGQRGGLVRADVRQLPFRDEAFDLATSVWLLETTPDPSVVLREAVRVLAPNGQAIMLHSLEPSNPVSQWWANLVQWLGRPWFQARFLDRAMLSRGLTGLRVVTQAHGRWAAVTCAAHGEPDPHTAGTKVRSR